MSFLDAIMNEFVISDVSIFREFDSSNFISNANSSLNKANTKLSFEINKYSHFLIKSINSLSETILDKNAVKAYLSNTIKEPEVKILIDPINLSDVITIKPQYLSEYMRNIASSFDRTIADNISKEEIDRYVSGDMTERVKRQVVKTTIEPGFTNREILKIKNKEPKVLVDLAYIKDKVIPFVEKYELNKANLLGEAQSVLEAIKKAESDFNASIKLIDDMRSAGNVSEDILKKLNYVSYSALRGLIEVISYTTFMTIRKLSSFQANILSCNELYVKSLSNIIESYDDNEVTESLKEITGVVGSTTGAVAADLIRGKVDAYKVMSDNIYQYHTGLIKNPDDATSIYDVNGDVSGYNYYDNKVYEDTIKIFIDIAQGLDIILAESDEYLLVFDDIIDNSGFTMELTDRFKGTINKITDISNYASAALGEVNAYQKMLVEIKDFPHNMQRIADIILEDKTRMETLIDRFEHNINGEFKNAATINELKIFMTSLTEQYNALINTIAAKYMERLRTLGLKADEYNGAVHNAAQPLSDMGDTMSIDVIDNTDYVEMAIEETLDDEEMITKSLFKELEDRYFKLRELSTKGLELVTEAEPAVNANQNQNQTQNNVNTQNNPNQPNNTKPKVVDNSGINSNGSTGLSGLKERIMKWFSDVIQKFSQKAKDLANDQKVKDIKDHQQDLISRSYNNVTINMLPYNNMNPNNIGNDLNKMANTIKNINPQVVQNIQKKEDWYSRVLSMINGGIDANEPLNNQLLNYYKTGTRQSTQLLSIANNELKTFVSGTMLPYITGYENMVNNINQRADQVKEALNTCVDKLSTQPATESVNYFEAEANTEVSMGQKANWLKEIVQIYVGSVFNALRDRSNDYISVCHQLIPKKALNGENNNNQNQNNANNENNQNAGNDFTQDQTANQNTNQ